MKMSFRIDRREDLRAVASLVIVFITMIWPIIEDLIPDLLTSYPDLPTVIVGIGTATIGVYFGVRQAADTIDPPPLGLPKNTIRVILLLFLVLGLVAGVINTDFINWGFYAGFVAAALGWLYGN
jgi:hypothetical protein